MERAAGHRRDERVELTTANRRTSSEIVGDLVPGAVVKAANTLGADVLGTDPPRPAAGG